VLQHASFPIYFFRLNYVASSWDGLVALRNLELNFGLSGLLPFTDDRRHQPLEDMVCPIRPRTFAILKARGWALPTCYKGGHNMRWSPKLTCSNLLPTLDSMVSHLLTRVYAAELPCSSG
jgi:hypothetical protein